jgi:hypothetical protein
MASIDTKRGSNTGDPYGIQSLNRDINNLSNPLAENDEEYEIDDVAFFESFFQKKVSQQAKMTSDVRSTLKSLGNRINIGRSQVLVESQSEDEEIN